MENNRYNRRIEREYRESNKRLIKRSGIKFKSRVETLLNTGALILFTLFMICLIFETGRMAVHRFENGVYNNVGLSLSGETIKTENTINDPLINPSINDNNTDNKSNTWINIKNIVSKNFVLSISLSKILLVYFIIAILVSRKYKIYAE